MSLLGRMDTERGPIELHMSNGCFFTRRILHKGRETLWEGERDAVAAVTVDPQRARSWYQLMRHEGVVYGDFPLPAGRRARV